MLLLVLHAEFDQRQRLGAGGVAQQPGHPLVHLGAPAQHLGQIGAGQQAALGARKRLAHTVVVAVEERAKGRVKGLEAGLETLEHEGLEKPGDVGQMPFGGAGVGHGLGLAVFGRQRRHQRQAARAHRVVAPGQGGALQVEAGRGARCAWGGGVGSGRRGGHGRPFSARAAGATAGRCVRRSAGR